VLCCGGSAGHLRDGATSAGHQNDKRAIVYRGGLVLEAVLLWLTDYGDTS
jgi:hypothetical protein